MQRVTREGGGGAPSAKLKRAFNRPWKRMTRWAPSGAMSCSANPTADMHGLFPPCVPHAVPLRTGLYTCERWFVAACVASCPIGQMRVCSQLMAEDAAHCNMHDASLCAASIDFGPLCSSKHMADAGGRWQPITCRSPSGHCAHARLRRSSPCCTHSVSAAAAAAATLAGAANSPAASWPFGEATPGAVGKHGWRSDSRVPQVGTAAAACAV